MSKLLVVEDTPELGILYQRLFHRHQVHIAATAWQAIALLEKEDPFDLVLLDMHLPEVSGMVVLQHIRKMPKGDALHVFVISADDTLRGKAELLGIQKWMTKPIELDDLLKFAAPYLHKDEPPPPPFLVV
ncbi:MAG: response regulator [Anaerolineae bacterium]|nr:response regulator [Anaerolineae bacterium]